MKNTAVDNGQIFDFGKTSQEYARYRDIYPMEMYQRIYNLGVGKHGTRWLDIGTGTGVLPRALAHYGADITATDLSLNQINEARRLSQGINNIKYECCSAEDLKYPDNSFNVITACQCFWYFDPEIIVPKIKSMLNNNGVFLKIYMEFLEDDPIAGRSADLVRRLNPNWTSGTAAIEDLNKDYFANPHTEEFYSDIEFTRESWHGRMKSCRGVLASMDEKTFSKFQDEHMKILSEFPEKFSVKHKIYLTYYYINK